ncbi:MAG: GNAT family N-acetyltransferase [Burkholderiaceae bacterium]
MTTKPENDAVAPHAVLTGPASSPPIRFTNSRAALDLVVRPTSREDIPGLIALQERIYPDIPPWPAEQVLHQLDVFPQGQVVALVNDHVVGCASSIMVNWNLWQSVHTWDDVTADGSFATHDPEGITLYGAEVFVDPGIRGRRIGHWLYDARRKICRALNLKRIIACGRMPGYHKYALEMSAETYAKRVVWGDIIDPVLNFQLREGFDFCGVMEGYIPEDRESGGFASLIVWLNPQYRARKPR